MAIVKCSKCAEDMEIDTPTGEKYIIEADKTIHHIVCPPTK